MQFLKLTTSTVNANRIIAESKPLNSEGFAIATQNQPLQLRIDTKTGDVLGHEGRHRMVALDDAGIQKVPVLLFDPENKYSKVTISRLILSGQDFGGSRSYDKEVINGVIPLSYANRDAIIQEFTTKTKQMEMSEKYGGKTTLKFSSAERKEYQQPKKAPLTKRQKPVYNEYNTNVMQWAHHTNASPGDTKVFYNPRNGKWTIVEAAMDGFVELRALSAKEVEEIGNHGYKKSRNNDKLTGELRNVKPRSSGVNTNAEDGSELRQDGGLAPVERVQGERAGDLQHGGGYRGVQEDNGVNAEAPDEGASSVSVGI